MIPQRACLHRERCPTCERPHEAVLQAHPRPRRQGKTGLTMLLDRLVPNCGTNARRLGMLSMRPGTSGSSSGSALICTLKEIFCRKGNLLKNLPCQYDVRQWLNSRLCFFSQQQTRSSSGRTLICVLQKDRREMPALSAKRSWHPLAIPAALQQRAFWQLADTCTSSSKDFSALERGL